MTVADGVFLDYATVDNGDLDRSRLEASLDRWTYHDNTAPDEVAERIAGRAVVVSNKVRIGRDVISSAPDLRLVALAATGTDKVDLAAAADHGVVVCNAVDYATDSVAQHAITLALNLLTGQPWYIERVRTGGWTDTAFFSMHDRPIREAAGLAFGVIGHGVLGQATAARAKGLGMEVLVAERRGREPRPGRVAFDAVIERADVLSIHCPLNDDTRGLVNAAVMARMKPDALIVNTARGGIVDERDLAVALRAGTIGGAGIDVLSEEPPPSDHPLLQPGIPNLLITPHNAWASRRSRQAVLDQLAATIVAFLAGDPVRVVT